MNKQISIHLGTGKLLHFASRSFWDVAMKDTSPQLVYRDDLQADGLNQTLAIIASGTLPGRMRYMSYLSVLEKEITINLEHEIMIVDHKLELETASRSLNLPSNATLWLFKRLHESYQTFTACLRKQKMPKEGFLAREHVDAWVLRMRCTTRK
mmetsp:Transcript_23976/g.32777  ORF Transcript_23976/g.32777 Transcript_23976/m.32777 type:complete len:153 (-) Transcript_23976:924-1382(-)